MAQLLSYVPTLQNYRYLTSGDGLGHSEQNVFSLLMKAKILGLSTSRVR